MATCEVSFSSGGSSANKIKVGDVIPEVVIPRSNGKDNLSTKDLFKGKVVLFAVPGAFTPTCSLQHLPGFVQHAEELKKQGISKIYCSSVNDSFVMAAWFKEQNVNDKVEMIADGSGIFTKAIGMERDASPNGMGIRSKRFAMIVEDGKVTWLAEEESGQFGKTSAESVLQVLTSRL